MGNNLSVAFNMDEYLVNILQYNDSESFGFLQERVRSKKLSLNKQNQFLNAFSEIYLIHGDEDFKFNALLSLIEMVKLL